MKRCQIIVTTILISILLASCANPFRITEEQKLLNELKKWENFSGNGIIELNAMGMSLRKDFNFAKSVQDLRLDMLDGGIFGSAGPLLSLYLGEYLTLEAPGFPALELLNLKDKIPASALAIFSSADYLLQQYGAEIIAEKALVRNDFEIVFNAKNYQLESLMDTKSGTGIIAKYDKSGKLDLLELKSKLPVSAKLIFDNVDYGRARIIPLPEKETPDKNLMDILKDGGMLDLLKGLKL